MFSSPLKTKVQTLVEFNDGTGVDKLPLVKIRKKNKIFKNRCFFVIFIIFDKGVFGFNFFEFSAFFVASEGRQFFM